MNRVFSISVTAALLFIPVSMLMGYVTSPASAILTDDIKRRIGVITICTSDELLSDVELAINEWNTAITVFSIRFMWPELLGLRLEVSEKYCDVDVILARTAENVNGLTIISHDNGELEGVVIISDKLSREKRVGVLVHELGHVLGLQDSIASSHAPYRMATDTSGLGKVTSHDVYALFVKYARGGDGILVRPPPYVAYMTVKEPLPDVASAAIAVFLTLITVRVMQQLRNERSARLERNAGRFRVVIHDQ